MILPSHLVQYVIDPTLHAIDLYSKSASNLLLGTYLAESTVAAGNTALHQLGTGPAIGIFQMEPATFNDLNDRWLSGKDELVVKLVTFLGYKKWKPEDMHGDLYLATAFCRLKYRSIPAELPECNDIGGLADYWKKWYNTSKGAGTTETFAFRLRGKI